MIGQSYNLDLIKQWRMNRSIPRFILISGQSGSGKLTLAKELMHTLNANGIILNTGIDDVRKAIENSYTVSEKTVYIFPHADEMRQEAQNALLKVTEEPPNKSYFILTTNNENAILSTIKSRSTELKMQSYTTEELKELDCEEELLEYFNVPGKIKIWKERNDLKQFLDYVDYCIDIVRSGTGVQCLQLSNRLQLKDTQTELFPLDDFLQIFCRKYTQISKISTDMIIILQTAKNKVINQKCNKKAVVDLMFQDLRGGCR